MDVFFFFLLAVHWQSAEFVDDMKARHGTELSSHAVYHTCS